MGEKKAIIFSTHILEEVEAACTRAIIIDRGAIVANGTPAELKARSDRSGAVLLALRGASAAAVTEVLAKLAQVSRSEILADDAGRIAVRAFPDHAKADGAFARASRRRGAAGALDDRAAPDRGRAARRRVPVAHAARYRQEMDGA